MLKKLLTRCRAFFDVSRDVERELMHPGVAADIAALRRLASK